MAATELGQKQICPNCMAKFYDLNKRPAMCPKCQTAFDPEEAVRTRRIRTRAPDYEAEEEKEEVVVAAVPDEFEEEADETPEIDEPAAAEPLETDEEVEGTEGATPAPAADIGVDFAEEGEVEGADEDDVPFLEDEDEDEAFDEEDIEGLPGEEDAER